MATRIKKQPTSSPTSTTTPPATVTSASKEVAAESVATEAEKSVTTPPPKKLGRPFKNAIKTLTGLKKTVQLKAKVRNTTKKNSLKINPKSLVKVLIENGKDGKKVVQMKNGDVVRKPGRPKQIKIKTEPPEEDVPMVLEPIFPQEENLEVPKVPKKRGRKPYKLLEVKTEPLDEDAAEASIPKPKKPRQRKPKSKPASIDEVMTDLSFLINEDQIKTEIDETPQKTKKLTKKQRLELIKNDLTKKEDIENTLNKLDPADVKLIDQLDLNVRNVKTDLPKIKRRHSIEKFPISQLDVSGGDRIQSQFFSQLPRCLSPKTSRKGLKHSKRSSPYLTRSDNPTRSLRNGKHRKLRDLALLEGLENPKRRKRVHSDLSGSETASKLSGYESDSSYSDLNSLYGSEKDADVTKPVLDGLDDIKSISISAEPLVDTNSNVCSEENEDELKLEESSLKLPDKDLLLQIMKQNFNDISGGTHNLNRPTTSDDAKLFNIAVNQEVMKEEDELRQLLEATKTDDPLKEEISDEAPKLEKQLDTQENDEIVDQEPPLLESIVPDTKLKSRSLDDEKLGIAVTEKDNVVLFTLEHLSDDILENDVSNEEVQPSCEDMPKEELSESKVEEVEEESVEETQENGVIDYEALAIPGPSGEQRTENCDNTNEINNESNKKDVEEREESPEDLAEKESILNALGLQSSKAQKPPQKRKSKATNKSDNYTGTLKHVIKINKKKGKNSFKMTLQKKTKTDGETSNKEEGYKIMKEGSSSSKHPKQDGTESAAGAHRKSHYSNRSNMENSGDQTSDGESGQDKSQAEKNLIVPEKASSFSIHPGRLCKDECSYCFGKFGLFDTPCHIAQIKSVDRQNKILDAEKHLTSDSCLCDACYRHVDRKSNSPSYVNKSLKRNSLVAPGPKQNHCHVLGCEKESSNILRRKWIIKMRKSICQAINIDLDNPGLHSIPICDEHFTALEHLMVCAMCKRRLARNHIHYLGPEVQELNEALKSENISIVLNDKPVVCKLCKCFASIILKAAEERMENCVNFFNEYKKRLLHFNEIILMDSVAAEEPLIVPTKNEKPDKKEETSIKRKKRSRNSSNDESGGSTKEDKDEETVIESKNRSRVASTDTNNSASGNQSSPEDDADEYGGVDYNTLIPAIAMDCSSDNETKKESDIPKIQTLGSAIEISRTFKSDNGKSVQEMTTEKITKSPAMSLKSNYWQDGSNKLISNPNLSVRQLFPGEEEQGLMGEIDFKNVLTRTPEGWEKCTSTIQYDMETKLLWQELQKPYGSQSSFLRHLILLEKYFRNGDLMLSPTASHHAINYRESVHNRLRAYDNIPSGAGQTQPATMVQFNKSFRTSGGGITNQTNGLPSVSISQVVRDSEISRNPVTIQQLNQPALYPTATMISNLTKNKPPGLISLNSQRVPNPAYARNQTQSQKIKFPITKNWRPNLIPIDSGKKQERKPGLVQVISGGKPYHITLEDYKKMCAIKRSFEAKQKKIHEQGTKGQTSLLKSSKKVLSNKMSGGGILSETKPISLVPINSSATVTSESAETILEKLDKQVERLGQNDNTSSLSAIALKKNPAIQLIPRIPKSLTVIPQTVRKSLVKSGSSGSSADDSSNGHS